MDGFSGFPDGKFKLTPLPEPFFSELLPLVDDLYELKVTLHCLWLLYQKQGEMRHVTSGELEGDKILMRGLQRDARSMMAHDALFEGLERAVARGTLLQVDVQRPGHPDETWYFVNSERGRAAVSLIERGEWVPQDEGEAVHLQARRPNIFNLYESNFGLIRSPLLADELKDAERTYPAEWIEEAFRIALGNNVRRWAYVRGILQSWAREGRGRRESGESREGGRRYVDGKYADFIEH